MLYRSAFQTLLDEVPGMYARLLTTLSKRLLAQDERLAPLG
ncbi:MAG TPA: hypothetical protein VMM81_07835 [Acidimicrobiia bacterium]|nr:hypothetical protein [Acidimicrobiia bacterium]